MCRDLFFFKNYGYADFTQPDDIEFVGDEIRFLVYVYMIGENEELARLSQIATSFSSHLYRTWNSWFWLIWVKRNPSIASDSAFGTPTMRRVKPASIM